MTEEMQPAPWWRVFNPAHYTILVSFATVALWINNSITHAVWEINQVQARMVEQAAQIRELTYTVNTTGADVRVLKVQVQRIEHATNLTMLDDTP